MVIELQLILPVVISYSTSRLLFCSGYHVDIPDELMDFSGGSFPGGSCLWRILPGGILPLHLYFHSEKFVSKKQSCFSFFYLIQKNIIFHIKDHHDSRRVWMKTSQETSQITVYISANKIVLHPKSGKNKKNRKMVREEIRRFVKLFTSAHRNKSFGMIFQTKILFGSKLIEWVT